MNTKQLETLNKPINLLTKLTKVIDKDDLSIIEGLREKYENKLSSDIVSVLNNEKIEGGIENTEIGNAKVQIIMILRHRFIYKITTCWYERRSLTRYLDDIMHNYNPPKYIIFMLVKKMRMKINTYKGPLHEEIYNTIKNIVIEDFLKYDSKIQSKLLKQKEIYEASK